MKKIFSALYLLLLSTFGMAQDLLVDTSSLHIMIDRAVICSEENRLDSACIYLAPIVEELDLKLRDSVRLANGWNVWIRCLLSDGRQEEALVLAGRCLAIRKKIFPPISYPVMQSLTSLGIVLDQTGRLDSSLQIKLQSYEVGRALLGENHLKMIPIYNNLSGTYNNLGDFKNAYYWGSKGLKLITDSIPENYYSRGYLANSIGVALEGMGRFDEGLAYKLQALGFWEEALGKEHQEVGLAHLNLGSSYYYQGLYLEAVKHLHDSYAILSETLGEGHPYVGSVLNNLSALYEVLQDYDQALFYNKAAMLLREKFLQAQHPELAQSYHNHGVLLSSAGYLDTALVYLEKARDIYSQGDKKNLPLYYGTLTALSEVLVEQRRYEAAVDCLMIARQGLESMPEISRLSITDVDLELGDAYYKMNSVDAAIKAYQRVVDERIQLYTAKHPEVATGYNSLGECYLKMNDFQEAISYFEEALISNNAIQGVDSLPHFSVKEIVRSHAGKGIAYSNWYKQTNRSVYLDSATVSLNKALRILDNEKEQFVFSESKERLSSTGRPIIAELIHLKSASSEDKVETDAEIFALMEQSKSYILLESMRQTKVSAVRNVPDSIIRKEINIRAQINDLEIQLLETAQNEEIDKEAIYALNQQMFVLKRAYIEFKSQLALENEQYYKLKYGDKTISLPATQALLDTNQGLLSYFVTDKTIFLFLVKKESHHLLQINNDFGLDSLVKQLCANVSKPYGYTYLPYTTAAVTLYDKLIRPIADLLPQDLMIAPDGVLNYLPFEALLSEQPRDIYEPQNFVYFLKKCPMSYCYSATLWQEMQEIVHDQSIIGNILAMAPFSTVNAINAEMSYSRTAEILALLKNSTIELDSLEAHYGATVFHGQEATLECFKNQAAKYAIIHISSHGQADKQTGDYSFLVFPPIANSSTYELLYARDLYSLRLNANLVVLPTCDTGVGELKNGEGIISLARAFAYAGAKSITTTLWQVDDQSTATLMGRYYHHLFAGLTKSQALQKAKIDYLQAGNNSNTHPAYWSALISIGDMSAIRTK